MEKRIVITESQFRHILNRLKLNEGQGFNMFRHDTRELWGHDRDMDSLRSEWENLTDSDGNYDEYINSGRNSSAYYGENDEWYDRNGISTDSEYDSETGVRNNRLNDGIGGKLGRRLGMAAVKAQIPFRMAAEPIYQVRKNYKDAMTDEFYGK